MHWFGGYGHNMGFGFGWLFMIILIILGVAGIVALLRMVSRNNRGSAQQDNAEALLRERYARGEISKEEFERIKDDLRR